jgi:hypothetical protein
MPEFTGAIQLFDWVFGERKGNFSSAGHSQKIPVAFFMVCAPWLFARLVDYQNAVNYLFWNFYLPA